MNLKEELPIPPHQVFLRLEWIGDQSKVLQQYRSVQPFLRSGKMLEHRLYIEERPEK